MNLSQLFSTATLLLTFSAPCISQIITTVAGSDTPGFSGDGGQASSAGIHYPTGIAFDSNGDLFFSDNQNYRIRKISASGTITTVAGNGQINPGMPVGAGPALSIPLYNPGALVVGTDGSIYFADYGTIVVGPSGNLTP